ncbi:hypothetical protein PVMG_06173 [Plasmodium vivax Mauritania I]|uniref:VIR protein n=1 Tax=Plasmodium vivax Mauritania I TaxID=1035515 RepID=A0A0J9TLH0_PLAVI|nr:hypothetical protein PVMG_06173 [Plasmodium vivax Mauritania I]
MALNSYERICPLNRFINALKDNDNNYEKFSTEDELQDIVALNNVTLKNIACSVYKGYTKLTAYEEDDRKTFCNYLNLWLDEQKSIYVKDKKEINDHQWEYIEKIWERLSREERERSRVCERQKQEKNSSDITKRINLMVYCVNRECIKKYCENAIRSNKNIEDKCQNFSLYTDKSHKELTQGVTCIDNTDEIDNYKYHISDKCSLYNMSKTFPVFNSDKKAILDDDNIRKAIKECRNAVKVVDRPQEQTDGIDGPSELPESNDNVAESGNDHAQSDVRPGPEYTPPNSIDLDLSSLTFETLHNNKPTKPIYYAGLSVSGVFFTSMVLYKV